MIASDVTSIVELPLGLSIEARDARHRLFLSRAIAGYEDVRAHVAQWRPIETRTGLAAFTRRWSHLRGERPWNPVTDAAMGEELAAVRVLAMPTGPRVVRPLRRLALVAVVWIAAIYAIWRTIFAG
jgi:hypothetical protein